MRERAREVRNGLIERMAEHETQERGGEKFDLLVESVTKR
jgi:hypothetical protein